MSWLQEQKAKADKEKAEREAKEAQDRAESDSRHRGSCSRAKRERDTKFGDLEGKMCWQELADGKRKKLGPFRSEVKDNYVTFYAGETKLGQIHYWEKEEEKYDSDGCSWGTGRYYEASDMWLFLPYKNKEGRLQEVQTPRYGGEGTSYSGGAYDEYLGQYLLNFVKP